MRGTNALPAGLMLFARRSYDRRLFAIAAALEQLHSC
jgi:Asp-tRNA(Asn)/Glu-tRNA(Gln) amidotransferase A subunit family amidase